ncbi:MAG: YceI family protein [Bacteroidia bacterium]|nr:YceI family protein [Bacteroidia bacterium]MDW8235623.1 YceI family protein [Bacteroidia bacterium]
MNWFKRLIGWLGLADKNGDAQRQALMKKVETFPVVSDWILDPFHTHVAFRIMHMGLVEVVGRFKEVSAKIQATSPSFQDLKVEVEVIASSVESDLPARDAHLKAPDFFDVENHPKILFRSTSVQWRPLKRFIMEGELTIRGKTHPIQLEGELKGLVLKDIVGEPRASFELKGEIDRRKWGLVWQMETADGTPVADNIVKIEVSCEIITPKALQALMQLLAQMQSS